MADAAEFGLELGKDLIIGIIVALILAVLGCISTCIKGRCSKIGCALFINWSGSRVKLINEEEEKAPLLQPKPALSNKDEDEDSKKDEDEDSDEDEDDFAAIKKTTTFRVENETSTPPKKKSVLNRQFVCVACGGAFSTDRSSTATRHHRNKRCQSIREEIDFIDVNTGKKLLLGILEVRGELSEDANTPTYVDYWMIPKGATKTVDVSQEESTAPRRFVDVQDKKHF